MSDLKAPMKQTGVPRRRSFWASMTLKLLGRWGARIGLVWVVVMTVMAVFAPVIASSHPILWKVSPQPGDPAVWSSPMWQNFSSTDLTLLIGVGVAGVLMCCRRSCFADRFWAWLAIGCWAILWTAYRPVWETVSTTLKQNDGGLLVSDWISIGGYALGGALLLACAVGLLFVGAQSKIYRFAPLGVMMVLGVVFTVFPVTTHDDSQGYWVYRSAINEGRVEASYFTLIPYSPSDNLINDTQNIKINASRKKPGFAPTEEDVAAEMISFAEGQYTGVKSYELLDADGEILPVPRTIAAAQEMVDLLWAEYSSQPVYKRQAKAAVDTGLADLTSVQLGWRFHLMGTTVEGCDLASRMIHGSRIALTIGFISTGIAMVIGIVIGGVMGYFSGWVDLIGMRLVEVFAAIPVIFLLIMIVAFYGRNLYLMMVVLGLTGWVGYAYFIRAEFLKLRQMDYIQAARALGTPLHRILFQHMLPNGATPLLVSASFGIAGAILTEATLSFIGLGLEEEPSWGQMLSQGSSGGSFSWWLAIYPGLAIFLTIFAYNLIGEALRDALDPRAAK